MEEQKTAVEGSGYTSYWDKWKGYIDEWKKDALKYSILMYSVAMISAVALITFGVILNHILDKVL